MVVSHKPIVLVWVTNLDPMNRGLKRCCSWWGSPSALVTNLDPMNRGLKLGHSGGVVDSVGELQT